MPRYLEPEGSAAGLGAERAAAHGLPIASESMPWPLLPNLKPEGPSLSVRVIDMSYCTADGGNSVVTVQEP